MYMNVGYIGYIEYIRKEIEMNESTFDVKILLDNRWDIKGIERLNNIYGLEYINIEDIK